MAIVDDIKSALRLSGDAFDSEAFLLASAAKCDLVLSGVPESLWAGTEPTDDLVKLAVIVYAKAHFGIDNPESERFLKIYYQIEKDLSLHGDGVVDDVVG